MAHRKAIPPIHKKIEQQNEEIKQQPSDLDAILYGPKPPPEPIPDSNNRPLSTQLIKKRTMHMEKMKQKYGQTGLYTTMEFKPNDNRMSPTKNTPGNYIRPKDVNIVTKEDTGEPQDLDLTDLLKDLKNKPPTNLMPQIEKHPSVPQEEQKKPEISKNPLQSEILPTPPPTAPPKISEPDPIHAQIHQKSPAEIPAPILDQTAATPPPRTQAPVPEIQKPLEQAPEPIREDSKRPNILSLPAESQLEKDVSNATVIGESHNEDAKNEMKENGVPIANEEPEGEMVKPGVPAPLEDMGAKYLGMLLDPTTPLLTLKEILYAYFLTFFIKKPYTQINNNVAMLYSA